MFYSRDFPQIFPWGLLYCNLQISCLTVFVMIDPKIMKIDLKIMAFDPKIMTIERKRNWQMIGILHVYFIYDLKRHIYYEQILS